MMRLRALLRRATVERELDEEIRFHLEQETAKLLAAGHPAPEARRLALATFGGVERAKEDYRDGRGDRWRDDLVMDTRYALRALRRNPALTSAAVLTLGLSIAATMAMFTAVNAVLLRPLPYRAPDRLVALWEDNADKGWRKNSVAPANLLDWGDQVGAFTQVAAFNDWITQSTLTGFGDPQVVNSKTVTGNTFEVLGVRAALGRTLVPAETWVTGNQVVVVSDRMWRDRLRADPSIVGRTVELDGARVQVVGVMPAGFAFPTPEVDVWQPTAWDPASRTQVFFRRAHWLRAIARLRDGVRYEQAATELSTVAHRLEEQYPATNVHMAAGLSSLQEFLVGDTRTPLMVLLAASLLLLAIACANVGNLLLVRAAAREREVVLRRALGAGRFRLVRQALTESLVLSAIGGGAGYLLGWWATKALVRLQPAGLLPVRDLRPDGLVFLFILAVTTLSGILFGLAPAIWSGRRAPAEVLKDGARTGTEGRRLHRWGNVLVVSEVGLALALTLGAGLLARSFWPLVHVSPGFEPHGVLAVELQLPGTRYDTRARVTAFFDALIARASALPGVEGVATVAQLPLTSTNWTSDFTVAGREGAPGRDVVHREISTEYFRVMRVPLLAGRAFAAADRPESPRVVIINQALARQYFPGEDPVGQRLCFDAVPDSNSVWRTIVGVVGNEHQATLALEPKIEVFTPMAQDARAGLKVVLRTSGDPPALVAPLRQLVAAMDPTLAFLSTQTMDDVRTHSMARERFLATLLTAFAVVGVVLALVGVYGVMAQLALRRTREMGIRIALGAQAPQVRWIIVRHGMALLLAGVASGIGVAFAASGMLSRLLFRVAPFDAATFSVVPVLILLTGLAASWLPASRATRADPAETLRDG
jgi:putative ABC transport system permease protein